MRPVHRSVLLLLGSAFAAACGRHQPAAQAMVMPPAPVTVATLAARDLPMTLRYLGRTEGSREVEIRARVSGFLDSRHFVEGADVAAGDLLFRLDERPLLAQQATAQADLQTAAARVAQTEREARRLRPLVDQQAVSAREADDADAAERIAAAELAAARARLQQIEVDLGYARVTAPMAGRIGRVSRFFIDRPIFAFVISILLVLAGLAAMRALPIAQYPEIAPPVVTVRAIYPGASAETMPRPSRRRWRTSSPAWKA
jgi:membrane fusion protein (multidrug efflux system)